MQPPQAVCLLLFLCHVSCRQQVGEPVIQGRLPFHSPAHAPIRTTDDLRDQLPRLPGLSGQHNTAMPCCTTQRVDDITQQCQAVLDTAADPHQTIKVDCQKWLGSVHVRAKVNLEQLVEMAGGKECWVCRSWQMGYTYAHRVLSGQ